MNYANKYILIDEEKEPPNDYPDFFDKDQNQQSEVNTKQNVKELHKINQKIVFT